MRAVDVSRSDGFDVRRMRRRLAPTLRWVIIIAAAGYWSLRPAPIAQDVLYGNADTPASPSAGEAGTVSSTDTNVGIDTVSAVRTIDWRILAMLDVRSTVVPPTLARLNGQRVRLPGFIVPLEDFQDQAKEFLLVPYFGACVHTPPPPPNQMVLVKLTGGPKSLALFDPVWIEGVLEIQQVSSPYGVVSYRMRGERIVPYRENR
jgi:hypothetical protein